MDGPELGELFRILTRIEAEMKNLLHRDVYFADREVQVVKYDGIDKRLGDIERDQEKIIDRQAAFRAQVVIALIVFALSIVGTLIVSVVQGG